MLKRNYDSCVIGFNYISLINGIIELKNGRSVLILDDPSYAFANQWFLNIGELEKGVLEELGKKHDIQALKNIDQYLKQENTLFMLNDKQIELTDSYYLNVKELARKLPQSVTRFFIDQLENYKKETFDKEILYLLKKIQEKSLKTKNITEIESLFASNQENTKVLFKEFNKYLQKNDRFTKQLHFTLQMSYQNIFSNELLPLESVYLFLSIISKRYHVDQKRLLNDLIFDFRKLGGDIKKTEVEDWGIKDNELHFILLKSIDGLLEVGKCFYYGQLGLQNHFSIKAHANKFSSIQLKYTLEHPYIEYFKNKRIICNDDHKMGSDFPYWEFHISHLGELNAIYCFTDQLGTKPSFYYHQALEDIYFSLNKIFPGLRYEHWLANTTLSRGLDVWLEYPGIKKRHLTPKTALSVNHQNFVFDGKKITNLSFQGPERGQVLGLYGYLVDLFSTH